MIRIILKPGEEKRILAGHPWVYDNEVARILAPVPGGFKPVEPGDVEGGDLADVESSGKTYLGRGFVNPHSKIFVRIYSPSKEGVDKGFFKHRFRDALTRRLLGRLPEQLPGRLPAQPPEHLPGQPGQAPEPLSGSPGQLPRPLPGSPGQAPGCDILRESARIVFGEADFLPGLIVDRFVGWPAETVEGALGEGGARGTGFSGEPLTFDKTEAALGPPASWLAIQFLSQGMDRRREEILAALEELTERYVPAETGRSLGLPAGMVEKSAARVRELEGLPLREGPVRGSFPAGGIVIFENGFPFMVHLEEGQKTGHYLDQRENRLRAAAFASGGRVLDACSYTGGFAIHAARFGALSVNAVDVSAEALEVVRKNARLNGVEDRITPVEGDVFEVLRGYERARERFDLIILDPPAFAKSRNALEGALRGYKEINLRAIKLLSPGGVLVSCSCSQVLSEGRFKAMIAEAAADAERRLIQLDFRYQGADHPILLGYDESLYLKCGCYRAL